jgi:hypothetical protein
MSSVLSVSIDSLEMTIEPALGARILSCSFEGQNVLLEAPAVAGTDNANNFGATFWPSPQTAWGWPPIAAIDTMPYAVASMVNGYTLTSAEGSLLGGGKLRLTKTFAKVPGRSAIDVGYTMTNVGECSLELAAWQIARVRAGGLTFFRLGEGGISGDKLATVTRGGVQWYEYDAAVVVAQGQKTFADGTGWLAHVDGDLILIQAFPDVPKLAAAPGEAEVELYADPSHTYLEIEPQGPILTIAPGASAAPWTVRWWLKRLPADLANQATRLGDPRLVAYVESIVRS